MISLGLVLSLFCGLVFFCAAWGYQSSVLLTLCSLACVLWFFATLQELRELHARGAFDDEDEEV